MPAPTDLNSRIALAKGWSWQDDKWFPWHNATGGLATLPDYVGTLEGVAGLMRELNEAAKPDWWDWAYFAGDSKWLRKRYYVARRTPTYEVSAVFTSPDDHPGDCVGDAWMSVTEAADAS